MVAHWDEFKVRYMKELEAHPAELNDLRQLAVREQITLLTAAKEEQHNLSLIHISEPTRHFKRSRMPSSA